MSTWLGVIVETGGRADFWEIAQKHGVEATAQDVPRYVLIDCGHDVQATSRLAEAMSKDLGATAIGFVVQTTADVHEVYAFEKGAAIRRLGYSRDGEGWEVVEGTPQPWERAYFFDDAPYSFDDDGPWPDMLWDDISKQDIARYEAARQAGDASSVLQLFHPSSTAPMQRVCTYFSVEPAHPHARMRKRSFLSRLWRQ
jgi:hypothetical protein